MAVTKHSVYSKHIIQKRVFDSVLSSLLPPTHSYVKVKSKQLINNPWYIWICCCQKLWHVKRRMVEVQWKTGILQIHWFVLPSRRCMLREFGKLLWCLSASSGEVPIWEEGLNHDIQTQSCTDVVLNNIKAEQSIYAAVLIWPSSTISVLQNIAPWWKKSQASLEGKVTVLTRVLTKLLSFYFSRPSLLKLFS